MGLLVGDSGAVDERRVSEQLGRAGRETMAAAVVLVLQNGREADVDRVLKGLELRLLVGKNKTDHSGICPSIFTFTFCFTFCFTFAFLSRFVFLSERKIVNPFYRESL